jgi:flagellar hook assembly protein FlgD
VIRRLETHGDGDVALAWDGRTDAGLSAAPGVYTVRVRTEEGSATSRWVLLP